MVGLKMQVTDDFILPSTSYLLNHSVGRPLKSSQTAFNEAFFAPWQTQAKEPWQQWLQSVEGFTHALSKLFNSPAKLFCPQVNLSSGLTKLVMSHPRLQRPNVKVLMAEADFPSMGFAMHKALPSNAVIDFVPSNVDITDANVWQHYLQQKPYDLVFISHVYSNTGQQAPVAEVVQIAKLQNTLTLVDVAQSAGVLPLDLTALDADFMLGSSVKWLCGGPGAAYLWLHEHHLEQCKPKDVGWFSHQNPFEFDIHHFQYHQSALRFWGGTPSVAPYALAKHSINYFTELGISKVREHNWQLLSQLHDGLAQYVRSPAAISRCSGTVILGCENKQAAMLTALQQANIAVDERALGIRLSPHIYNTSEEIQQVIDLIQAI